MYFVIRVVIFQCLVLKLCVTLPNINLLNLFFVEIFKKIKICNLSLYTIPQLMLYYFLTFTCDELNLHSPRFLCLSLMNKFLFCKLVNIFTASNTNATYPSLFFLKFGEWILSDLLNFHIANLVLNMICSKYTLNLRTHNSIYKTFYFWNNLFEVALTLKD